MELPTKKTPASFNLQDEVILIYGPPKIGKSSFCAEAEDALFLATEAGLSHLDVFQIPITSWIEMVEALAMIAKGEHTFKTIVMDTVDNAYKMCSTYICEKHGVKHESDLTYGKGWALVNGEFQRVLNKLSLLPNGLFLVSHSQEKTLKDRTGEYIHTRPSLPDSARKILLGMCDLILYFNVYEQIKDEKIIYHRVIYTKEDKHWEAGDRTGKLPEIISLDYSKFVNTYKEVTSEPKTKDKEK